ncbi:MAG: NADH-quinone oxidoreductase subunit NuoE [Rectinema sp.]
MVAGDIEFSNELQSYIDEWSKKEGGLVMMLHRIQNEFGYVPRAATEKLSLISGIPLAKIYGVITFYHFFKTTKPGKHRIAVCLGTACYLKGGQDLLEETCSILSIEPNEMTDDGLFSVDEVRCLGCCGLAPVLMIDNEVYGKLTKEQLPGIIAKYRSL